MRFSGYLYPVLYGISFLLLKVAGLQIPCHRRQPYHQTVKILAHRNLTPQARGLCQPKRQIQHVVLVVGGFFHLVEHVGVFDNDMTSRAGAGTTAGTYIS